eukprot:1188199-Prorocentrum_minimum.AAC.3
MATRGLGVLQTRAALLQEPEVAGAAGGHPIGQEVPRGRGCGREIAHLQPGDSHQDLALHLQGELLPPELSESLRVSGRQPYYCVCSILQPYHHSCAHKTRLSAFILILWQEMEEMRSWIKTLNAGIARLENTSTSNSH